MYGGYLIASVAGAQGLDPTLIEIEGPITGGSGDDYIYGDNGNNHLTGGQGDDTLIGGDGDDYLSGGDDNDALSGGDGDDNVYGGRGDDILNGGDGDDILTGGGGEDTFHIEIEPGNMSTITDFVPAQDTIILELYSSDLVSTPYNVTVENWTDGTGADLLVNGAIVAHVAGAQNLDPAFIVIETRP